VEIDESIVQLGTKLDEWFDANRAAFASQDRVVQSKALLSGTELVKELDRLKASGLTAIKALLNERNALSDDARAASLIKGFEFGARLADTLHDELLDTDGETTVVRLTDAIVKDLDVIGSGRAALAKLLDHPDAGVRALPGVYLIDLIPDRWFQCSVTSSKKNMATAPILEPISRFSVGSVRASHGLIT